MAQAQAKSMSNKDRRRDQNSNPSKNRAIQEELHAKHRIVGTGYLDFNSVQELEAEILRLKAKEKAKPKLSACLMVYADGKGKLIKNGNLSWIPKAKARGGSSVPHTPSKVK